MLIPKYTKVVHFSLTVIKLVRRELSTIIFRGIFHVGIRDDGAFAALIKPS